MFIIFNFVIEYFFAFVVFDVVAHGFDFVSEAVEDFFEGFLIGVSFHFEQFDEFEVDVFGAFFGFLHGLEISLFVCVVEGSDVFLHSFFVEFPCVVYTHIFNIQI